MEESWDPQKNQNTWWFRFIPKSFYELNLIQIFLWLASLLSRSIIRTLIALVRYCSLTDSYRKVQTVKVVGPIVYRSLIQSLAANRVVYGPRSHSARNSSAVCVQFPFPSWWVETLVRLLSVPVPPFSCGGVTVRFKTLGFVLNFIAIFFESQRAGLILRPLLRLALFVRERHNFRELLKAALDRRARKLFLTTQQSREFPPRHWCWYAIRIRASIRRLKLGRIFWGSFCIGNFTFTLHQMTVNNTVNRLIIFSFWNVSRYRLFSRSDILI